MNKKAVMDPLNLIMGVIAICGAILIIFNKGDFGLILLIIASIVVQVHKKCPTYNS